MTKIIQKNYKVISDKIDKKIVLLSDLHYSSNKDSDLLNEIIENIKTIGNIDYICIAGDFLDQSKIKDEDVLLGWFNELTKIAKNIIISLGNHDVTGNKKKHEYYFNQKLIYELNKNKKIHVLDNSCYVDGKIRFIGITLPHDYYYSFKENNNYFIRYINNVFKKEYSDKYNILLCHSPYSVINDDVQKRVKLFSNINLAMSGHTHGGLVPYCLRNLLKGKGIISPHYQLFPKYSYGIVKGLKFDTIISSGIQKLHFNKPMNKLNRCFYREITIINIGK